MATDRQEIREALIDAAYELRKKAEELRNAKPVVKTAGFSVNVEALRELIREGK